MHKENQNNYNLKEWKYYIETKGMNGIRILYYNLFVMAIY